MQLQASRLQFKPTGELKLVRHVSKELILFYFQEYNANLQRDVSVLQSEKLQVSLCMHVFKDFSH